MQIKPLTGIKVIDLSRLWPGPICTLHLADMGASVIKVEDKEKGDYSRSVPPLQKTNSSFFLAVNRNKSSVALDLTKEEGKNIFLKLAKSGDVIVESFRPGVAKKLGIDYEAVKNENPKIVYCSITGYGQTGPYRDKAGHDLNFCSYAGMLDKTTEGKNIPSVPQFQIADIVGGSLNAVMGILAALVYQKTTGQGQYIDVSILDGVLAHYVTALSSLESPKEALSINDLLTGKLPCYNIYETADKRFMAVAALEFKFWKRFCEAIGKEGLITEYLKTGEVAVRIHKELSAIFRTKTLTQWVDHFKDIDCCVSPVLTLKETLETEQVKSRNMVLAEEHPIEGSVTQFSLPVKFSSFEFNIEKPAPMLGENTEEILSELGYSASDISELKIKKVI